MQSGSSVAPFIKSVKNLGVILDSRLSIKEHVSVPDGLLGASEDFFSQQYLTEDGAKTLVASFVLSCLDYGNCMSPCGRP